MRRRRSRFSVLLAALAFLAGAPAQSAETLVVPGHFLDVFIDMDHCEWLSSLCIGSGSFGPAADGNDSVVVIAVHVKGPLGNPISGLAEADFALFPITNPGGSDPVFVGSATCAACFAEPQPGVYRFAVRTASGTWSLGTFMTLLDVTYPSGASRQTVIPIDIPL